MKHWIGFAAVGLFAWLFFLLAQLPANFVWQTLEKRGPALPVALYGVEGSLWNGRAAAVVIDGHGFGELHWRLSALALLAARANGTFDWRQGNAYGSGRFSLRHDGSARVDDLTAQFSIKLLQPLIHYPVAPKGELLLRIESAHYRSADNDFEALDGRLQWRGAGIEAPQSLAFGDLVAELSLDNGQPHVLLGDLEGPLGIDGVARLQGGQWRLQAELWSRDSAPAELSDALRMIGQPDARGRVRVNL